MITELKNIIQGEVSDSSVDLEKYSRDASIFEVKPQLVVYPKDAEDLKKLVSWAATEKSSHQNLSLTARSAGTDMSGGPLNDSIIIDFTRHFSRVLEVGDGYAVAEPGVYYRDFEKATLKKGLLMPAYPASREICTIGGMVANNSGGEKSLSYGKTDRYVQNLEVILSDGNSCVLEPLALAGEEKKRLKHSFRQQV